MLNQRESFFRILHCLTTQIRYFVGRFFFERMSVYKNSESFAMWLCLAEYRGFFDITNDTTFFNYPFDFESITFFFPYAWAIDPSKPTLTPKYESVSIPYKVSLSKYDILNIQREYKCGIGNNYIRLSQDNTYHYKNFFHYKIICRIIYWHQFLPILQCNFCRSNNAGVASSFDLHHMQNFVHVFIINYWLCI